MLKLIKTDNYSTSQNFTNRRDIQRLNWAEAPLPGSNFHTFSECVFWGYGIKNKVIPIEQCSCSGTLHVTNINIWPYWFHVTQKTTGCKHVL